MIHICSPSHACTNHLKHSSNELELDKEDKLIIHLRIVLLTSLSELLALIRRTPDSNENEKIKLKKWFGHMSSLSKFTLLKT